MPPCGFVRQELAAGPRLSVSVKLHHDRRQESRRSLPFPDTDAFRSGWSLLSRRSTAALHTKAMAFDSEAVFVRSFNLDSRSAVINTEAGLYIESPELAKQLPVYMATGVVPANSYRVLLTRMA
jgi:phosphatidylserine/phosphatidylglycerophosphate/cardiolipin synthase-like enzyme